MSSSSTLAEIRVAKPLAKPSLLLPQTGTFRALRHRNYRLYFFGQMISLFGSWMQTPALMLVIYQLTKQSSWTSAIAAVSILPTLFLGGLGGSLADRVPRRGLIFVCQFSFLIQAMLLALLTSGWLGPISPWTLLALAFFGGLINAFDLPARMTFLIDMVGKDDLVNAVGLNSLLFNLARVVGPAAAVGLMRWFSPSICFFCNGLSFLAVLGALAAMDPIKRSTTEKTKTSAPIRDGLRYLLARPELCGVLLLAAALCFCGWPTLALLPALSDHRFRSQDGVGYMLSALGVGAMLASWRLATFKSLERSRVYLALGVLLSTVGLLGLAMAETITIAMFCSGVLGAGLILFFATGQAVIQLGASDQNRGLLLGIWSMVLSGALPLGNYLFGLSADYHGEGYTMVLQAVGMGTAGIVIFGLSFWFRGVGLRQVVE